MYKEFFALLLTEDELALNYKYLVVGEGGEIIGRLLYPTYQNLKSTIGGSIKCLRLPGYDTAWLLVNEEANPYAEDADDLPILGNSVYVAKRMYSA